MVFSPATDLHLRQSRWSGRGLCLLTLCVLFFTATLCFGEEAFLEAVRQTKLSFHWDHLVEGVPQEATTARVLLPDQPASLLSLVFDPLQPSLYQTLEIQGSLQQCVLVATFTRKQDFWLQAEQGQDLHLRLSAGYDVFPWVVAGQSLPTYFQENYSTTLTPENVERRISQSLGMADRTGENRVLAFFWTPLDLVLRPAYSADISTSIDYSLLDHYSDTSYAVSTPSAGAPDFIFQDYTYAYHTGETGFGDFVAYNQASTQMPWTALGTTYNWNYLEDGEAGRLLDLDRVNSPIGPTEFVVSAGSWVQFSHFIENDQLYGYLIPEPGSVTLLLLGSIVLVIRFFLRKEGC